MPVLWSEVYTLSSMLIDGLGIVLFAHSYQRPWNQARQFTQAMGGLWLYWLATDRKKNYNT